MEWDTVNQHDRSSSDPVCIEHVQEDLDRELNLPPLKTETDVLLAHYIPVYVMLPVNPVVR